MRVNWNLTEECRVRLELHTVAGVIQHTFNMNWHFVIKNLGGELVTAVRCADDDTVTISDHLQGLQQLLNSVSTVTLRQI